MDSQAFCHPHRRQRVTALLYVGRHPHADKRGLQPASADALSGGNGLPPYQPCSVRRQRVAALLLPGERRLELP